MAKAIRASVLMLILASSAQAGYIHNDVVGPPPPPPPSVTQEGQTVKGVMPNDEPESLTETVLSVIESVLMLTLF
jgi:hypothetical protein